MTLRWDMALARDFIDRLRIDIEWLSPEMVFSLGLIEDRYLATPLATRAFVHGACGFDPAKDCTMTFFYAIFAGRDTYFNLVDKHEALSDGANSGEPFELEQAAWEEAQKAFWETPEIKALSEEG